MRKSSSFQGRTTPLLVAPGQFVNVFAKLPRCAVQAQVVRIDVAQNPAVETEVGPFDGVGNCSPTNMGNFQNLPGNQPR